MLKVILLIILSTLLFYLATRRRLMFPDVKERFKDKTFIISAVLALITAFWCIYEIHSLD